MHSHRPYKSDAHFEYWLRKKSHAWGLLVEDTEETLAQMLTAEEYRTWQDTVDRESPWINLKWWWDQPVMVPQQAP